MNLDGLVSAPSGRGADAGHGDSGGSSNRDRERKTLTERRFHVSAVSLDAIVFAAVRDRRPIETCLHRVLDPGFDVDRARDRKDHGPENLTSLRSRRSTPCGQASPTFPCGANASAPVGAMSSPAASLGKCDRLGPGAPHTCDVDRGCAFCCKLGAAR